MSAVSIAYAVIEGSHHNNSVNTMNDIPPRTDRR